MDIRLLAPLIVFVSYCVSAQDLAGTWEGPIQLASRPIIANIDFIKRAARFDQAGAQYFPLEDLRVRGRTLQFLTSALGVQFVFEGEISRETINGEVRIQKQRIPFSFRRLPELPAPRNRVEAWQQDLDTVLTRFLRYDRSFTSTSRARFEAGIRRLRASIHKKPDNQVMVELARAVALTGNAHTRLYLVRNRTEVSRLPLRVWWFRDELRVLRATSQYSGILGCRVMKVGDADTHTAYARVKGIKPGNEQWQRYMSTYMLTSREILDGVGIRTKGMRVHMEFACPHGRQRIDVRSLPLEKKNSTTEAWWDLSPVSEIAGEWRSVITTEDLPLYLQKPHQNYWFQRIDGAELLYFQYNRSQSQKDYKSVKDFGSELAAAVTNENVKALIVDLRFNTGGDAELATPLIKDIAAKLAGRPVFVITGRATFSAGITHATQWKQWAGAKIVGEPVGDELDTWSEGGNIVLPNSKLTIHYTNGFHSYSRQARPEAKPYFMDLDQDSIAPDITAELTWSDYLSGRDPALEAIRGAIRKFSP